MPTARQQADEIMRLKDAGVTPSELAIRLGIGRASVHRVLGEHEKVAACPLGGLELWVREAGPKTKATGRAIERGSPNCWFDRCLVGSIASLGGC